MLSSFVDVIFWIGYYVSFPFTLNCWFFVVDKTSMVFSLNNTLNMVMPPPGLISEAALLYIHYFCHEPVLAMHRRCLFWTHTIRRRILLKFLKSNATFVWRIVYMVVVYWHFTVCDCAGSIDYRMIHHGTCFDDQIL